MWLDIDLTLLQKSIKMDHTSKVKYETVKLLEDKREENLHALRTTAKTNPCKKIDKLDFIKFKHLCSAKDSLEKMKRQTTDLEKSF